MTTRLTKLSLTPIKQSFLFAVFLMISMISYSQLSVDAGKDTTNDNQPEFAPIGAEWYYNYTESLAGPETGYYLLKSVKDTTIDSKVCRILTHTYINSKGIALRKGESILYEDAKEKRIYRYLFGNFYLLYDFTKTTGDTIIVKEPYSETKYDSIVTVVDSVGIETVSENIQLKVLYVRPVEGRKYDFQGKIVEKIGNLLYLFPFNQLVCDGGCPLPLRCYNDYQINFVSHEPYVMQVPCDYIYPERMKEFAPIGAEWYYSAYVGFDPPQGANYIKHTCTKDSTINGKSVKVIQKTKFTREGYIELGFEYLHQNDDTIFYWKNGEFHYLYNFSLSKGDSIQLYVDISNNFPCDTSQYSWNSIDSVFSQTINNHNLKGYFATHKEGYYWGFDGFPIIEKIGSTGYLLPEDFGCVVDRIGIGPLRCYSDPEFGTFYNGKEPCDTITTFPVNSPAINRIDLFKLYPNPANNIITISNPSNIKINKIEMFDFSGRVIQQWEAHELEGNQLNIQHILPGIYLLKAATDAGIKIEKLVVQ